MIIMLVISKRSHLEKKIGLFVSVSSKHIPPKKKSKSKGDTPWFTKIHPLSLAPWLVAQQRIQLFEITCYGSAVLRGPTGACVAMSSAKSWDVMSYLGVLRVVAT